MSSYFLKRQLKDVRKQRIGPDFTSIRGTSLGSYILVFRENGQTVSVKWTGSFILLDISNSTANVLKNSDLHSFRLSFVNRFYNSISQETVNTDIHTTEAVQPNSQLAHLIKAKTPKFYKYRQLKIHQKIFPFLLIHPVPSLDKSPLLLQQQQQHNQKLITPSMILSKILYPHAFHLSQNTTLRTHRNFNTNKWIQPRTQSSCTHLYPTGLCIASFAPKILLIPLQHFAWTPTHRLLKRLTRRKPTKAPGLPMQETKISMHLMRKKFSHSLT